MSHQKNILSFSHEILDICDVLSRILKGRQPIPEFSIILKHPEKSGILYYIG